MKRVLIDRKLIELRWRTAREITLSYSSDRCQLKQTTLLTSLVSPYAQCAIDIYRTAHLLAQPVPRAIEIPARIHPIPHDTPTYKLIE